ncbi:response regulator [Candidatus Sumerlaeota bacterium]|nr:response regulator [Candidatus Sumerlaeota bacterium]
MPDRAPCLILIADVDPSYRQLLRWALEEEGHRVCEATDGDSCLRAIHGKSPDLILCDLRMPDTSGIEICRMIRSDQATRHIPFILIAEESDRSARLSAIEAGATDCMRKPLETAEMIARVRMIARSNALDVELRRQHRIIDNLLAISTLCQGYADASTRMFSDFGRRTGDLLRAGQVAVLLGRRGKPPEMLSCWPLRAHPQVMERILNSRVVGQILSDGAPIVIAADDSATQRRSGLNTGSVGVPILAHSGKVIGAIVAFETPADLDRDAVRILLTLAQRVGSEIQLRDHSERLEELVSEHSRDLVEAKEALETAHEETIFRLALAVEYRDTDTGIHLRRMSRFSTMLAQAVGLPQTAVSLISHASMMHDIGKIGIPDQLLRKPGKLTPEEYEVVKQHTVFGAQICEASEAPLLQMSERIALGHHEWWDGSGYPHGRRGDKIPIEARIVAVTDVFDALISDRPYKRAWPIEEAFEHVGKVAASQLDPMLVDAFLGMRERIQEVARELGESERTAR